MGPCSSQGKSEMLERQLPLILMSLPKDNCPLLCTSGTAILGSPTCIYHVCCQIFLLRRISRGIKFLHCFSPHTHRFCFWLIFPCGWYVYSDLYLFFFFWWGGSLEREKKYLLLKLVALGIIRLSPASWVYEEFGYVYSKCLRSG